MGQMLPEELLNVTCCIHRDVPVKYLELVSGVFVRLVQNSAAFCSCNVIIICIIIYRAASTDYVYY